MFPFLVAFAAGGNVSVVAKVVGIARRTVYLARETNPTFVAGWEDALAEAQDRIRTEVDKRAIEGWLEPVFGRVSKDKDGQIGTIRKSDSSLLARLAAAYCLEFRKGAPTPTVNVSVQIAPEMLDRLHTRKEAAMRWQASCRD